MKALIIGAAGFVGHYLTDYLQKHCKWSVVVTKLPHEQLEMPDTEVFDLDILCQNAIQTLLGKVQPDVIFHLAAQSSVALSWKNPTLTVDVNIKGALNLLESVRFVTPKTRVLLIGSGEEYGRIEPEETPIVEQTVLRPGNIYAATKACQNMLGKIYADAYGLSIILIRAFNHIGPGQAPLFVVADFCKQVAEIEAGYGTPVIKVGNLQARRDFTDVRDVVAAYALLAQRGRTGEYYNVGSGTAVTIQSILDAILRLSTADITVEADPARLRPVDVPVIEADVTKLIADTGWHPQYTWQSTLMGTLDFWREQIRSRENANN